MNSNNCCLIFADILGNPDKLKKGDTIKLGGKKKSSKKQLIKNACKLAQSM